MIQPRLLGGRYELDGVVGRGGMAEVYRARDLRLDRVVAVKTLREDLARDQTFQARFRREAQSAASLNHPSIVAVYDTGEDNSGSSHVPFIVMEYVDGRTIRDLLRDDRRLLPERALEITDGVLRALDYSHRNGIVHRDIKPGNVMLTRSGEIKVMDFGIARAVADSQATMTQTAQVIGTAQYLSPEQARGERVDFRSDLYSVGCLLYELLTGRPPFTGDSPVSIAYQHVRENPVPPTRVDPELPAWADAIVLRAMAKSPADRYQSAADMRADIQRALSGFPVAGPARGYGGTTRLDAMGQTRVQGGPTGAMEPYEYGPPAGTEAGPPGQGHGRRKRKVWPWVVAILAILIVAVGIGIYQLISGKAGNVAVPTGLVGKSLKQAESILASKGFGYSAKPVTRPNAVGQKVIRVNPAGGTSVPKGSTVTLYYAVKPGKVAIPQVQGLTVSQATNRLTKAGFTVAPTTKTVVSTTISKGLVVGSTPPSGTSAAPGTQVTLNVSGGGVAVPYVVGTPKNQAVQTIQSQNLQANPIPQTPPVGTPYGPGMVWKLSPAPGKIVLPGSTVNVYVVPGSPTPSPTPSTPSPSPSPTPSPTPSPSPSASLSIFSTRPAMRWLLWPVL
ncbi:MAG: Stk1 family PASTA domain-containing Ser/Thr kinase [Actinomycetota bacterium]|nr:Stk1 family PASTA domain-containing Ser/Thr kinase [Actinomycetota bacterium]